MSIIETFDGQRPFLLFHNNPVCPPSFCCFVTNWCLGRWMNIMAQSGNVTRTSSIGVHYHCSMDTLQPIEYQPRLWQKKQPFLPIWQKSSSYWSCVYFCQLQRFFLFFCSSTNKTMNTQKQNIYNQKKLSMRSSEFPDRIVKVLLLFDSFLCIEHMFCSATVMLLFLSAVWHATVL